MGPKRAREFAGTREHDNDTMLLVDSIIPIGHESHVSFLNLFPIQEHNEHRSLSIVLE